MVNTQTILSILRKPKLSGEICKELIRVANQNGGEDNITVLLLEVLGNAPDVTEPITGTVADSVTTT
jgi:serine/threonine protein phosphatase PrpC